MISLRRAPERRQQVLRQLLPLGLSFEIVDAVDAWQTKPEFLPRDEGAHAMKDGVVACYQSHIGVLERVVGYELDYGLILEDDFILNDSPLLSLATLVDRLPVGADHIQLHALKDFLSKDYEVDEEGEWFNKLAHTNVFTVGYVVSRRFAEHVLGCHRVPRMPIDLLYVELSQQGKFNFHDVRESLVEPNWSLTSTIENSAQRDPVAPKILCYTVALDMNEVKCYRQQARMLVASLKRSGFKGDIKIIHNGDTEIFDHPHPEVEEIGIDVPASTAHCYRVKFRARDLLSTEGYDWVMFLDTDFIVSCSLDGWFAGSEIIRFATEPSFNIDGPQFNGFLTDEEMVSLKREGINSGAFVVRADHFHEVMSRWEELDALDSPRCKLGDQHAWNRLLVDTVLPTKVLADPEVSYFYRNSHFMEMLKAPVLHFCGIDNGERTLAMQAKFISHFHTDGDGTLIRLLER